MKIKRILKYFGISVAILIMGFLIVAQIAYQGIPQIEPPGKMYSVNGGRFTCIVQDQITMKSRR